jgi:teichoic acid transport system permease protein
MAAPIPRRGKDVSGISLGSGAVLAGRAMYPHCVLDQAEDHILAMHLAERRWRASVCNRLVRMSHPERLGASGGGQANAIAEPPHVNGHPSLAEFAAGYGLKQSAARPPLGSYVRQLWQRRHFIWAFASAKNIAMYTESRLGQVWQVLTPLLNAAVYYLIFGLLLGTSRGLPHNTFIPFLVTGVFIFTFTQRSVNSGARSVGDNLSLIRALHFPRATLPLAYTIIELQQLLVSLGVLVIIVLGFGEPITWRWLLLFPVLLMQLTFNIGISLALARIGAFNRDINQLLPFVLRTWLYFSGIIYSLSGLMHGTRLAHHPWIGHVLKANPAYVYVELSRYSLLDAYRGYVQHTLHEPTLYLWWYAIGWAVVMFLVGFWFFFRAEERYGRG